MKWLPVYFIYLTTFGLASLEKFQGGVPDWFTKQFATTFLRNGPGGVNGAFYAIASLEALTCLLFLVSLLRLEWRQQNRLIILEGALFLSLLCFSVLGFGLRLTHDFTGTFQLFCYTLLTFGLLAYVEHTGKKSLKPKRSS